MELSWILVGLACVMVLVLVKLHRMATRIYNELDDLIHTQTRVDDKKFRTFARYLD